MVRFSRELKREWQKESSDDYERGRKLQNLYREMYQAMIRKDRSTLEEILDQDFVLVHMTGMRQPKEAFINAVEDGTLNYYAEETDSAEVNISGNTATLIGKSRVNAAVFGGGRHTWRLEQDLTCRKSENGKWKIAKSVASTY